MTEPSDKSLRNLFQALTAEQAFSDHRRLELVQRLTHARASTAADVLLDHGASLHTLLGEMRVREEFLSTLQTILGVPKLNAAQCQFVVQRTQSIVNVTTDLLVHGSIRIPALPDAYRTGLANGLDRLKRLLESWRDPNS